MTEPQEAEAVDTEGQVQYVGASHVRILSARDMAGPDVELSGEEPDLVWEGRGSYVPYQTFEEAAGSEERARHILDLCGTEFLLTEPRPAWAADPDEVEYEIGGSVAADEKA